MAKFTFSFEQLLSIKKKVEKQEQMKLGKAMQALSAQMQLLEVVKLNYNDSLHKLQLHLNGGSIQPVQIKQLNESVVFYQQQVVEHTELVRKAEIVVEQAKESVKRALQERKTYEILKEKAFEQYLEEEKQAEAKLIDEIVSFKYKET